MAYEINYSTSRAQLPRKMKQFCEIKFISSEYDSKWSKLENAIENIFQNIPINTNLEILYRIVESFPQEKSEEMFNNLKQLCLKHVSEFAPLLYKDESKDTTFLEHVTSYWDAFCEKIELLKRIFLFADRKYWSTNPRLTSVATMAMLQWRDMFVTGTLVNKTMLICMAEIERQRRGVAAETHAGQGNLAEAVARMFVSLDLYQRYWEPRYLEEARLFYSGESATRLASLGHTEYLAYVAGRLEEERERGRVFLQGEGVRLQARDQLVGLVLRPQLDGLLAAGFSAMVDQGDAGALERLHGLAQLVPGGPACLRGHFRQYVLAAGAAVVENPLDDPEKDRRMTQGLLDLKARLDAVVGDCFRGDAAFAKTVRDCFEAVLNARPNKPAEYLAKFLDGRLRAGRRGESEEAVEAVMDRVMTLFRFVAGKDVFEAFYLKDLAKRLLLGKSACVDTERAMLERLKRECGPNYTRKMEVMFADVENSARLSRQFQEAGRGHGQVEMGVHVICAATWPSLGGSKVLRLPPALVDLQEEFSRFYRGAHSGRKLRFEPALGSCVVRGHFPLGRKELQVSEFQCVVLLQFNGDGEGDRTFREVQAAAGLEEEVARRTLLSLCAGKGQRVLTKRPPGTTVNDEDVFGFNEGFHHRLTKIKFNQIQTKETKEEQQATEEQVFADRQAHLDCCIVRLMKCHRSIEHTQLVTEVLKELRFPLKGSDIKRRIEHLIERDYISRDAASPSMYHYVA